MSQQASEVVTFSSQEQWTYWEETVYYWAWRASQGDYSTELSGPERKEELGGDASGLVEVESSRRTG
jgi:hypothetical protein